MVPRNNYKLLQHTALDAWCSCEQYSLFPKSHTTEQGKKKFGNAKDLSLKKL